MKKNTFILVMLLLISQIGKAQLMEIGVKAGANYANLVNSN